MLVRTGSLVSSFQIDPSIRVVALVGAGGKTSGMFRLAAEIAATGRRVVTTTTTKIFPPAAGQSPALLLLDKDPRLETLPRLLADTPHVTVGRNLLSSGKLDGISESDLETILQLADVAVVEADGAAGRPVKAPEPWEPVIPAVVDLVIPVVGLDCVGKPATGATVFRLERFLSVVGIREGEPITPFALARLFAGPEGALFRVPSRARVTPLLNKIDLLDSCYPIEEVTALIQSHMESRINRIVVSRLREPIETWVYETGPVTGGTGGSGNS
ncbi:MAG: putative selenium-dependent hydroxylase accessory protein YqeC [Desulfomonile sp.]|nr:putative selenium-dependent hydroxylase accessory protein YqeC [Desulfomonile sp.]